MAEPPVTTRGHEKNVFDGKRSHQGPHGTPVFAGCVRVHATNKQGADSARMRGSREHPGVQDATKARMQRSSGRVYPRGNHG